MVELPSGIFEISMELLSFGNAIFRRATTSTIVPKKFTLNGVIFNFKPLAIVFRKGRYCDL